MNIKKMAFTLAEVVIVIGIVGIIAEMTLPTLLSNIRDQKNISTWKKTYSSINQATQSLKYENGGSIIGLFTDVNTAIDLYSTKLNVNSVCKQISEGSKTCLTANGRNFPGTMTLSDGVILALDVADANCSSSWGVNNFGQQVCLEFYAYLNGNKKPVTYGREILWLGIGPDKVFPAGTDGIINVSYKCPNGVYCNSLIYLSK